MSSPSTAIAIVEDEAKMRQAIGRLLRLQGYDVIQFESGDHFLSHLGDPIVNCVLLDVHLPGNADGFGVLEALQGRQNSPPVIVMTAHDEPGYAQRFSNLGASDYLLKPVDDAPLLTAIRRALGGETVPEFEPG